MSQSQEVLSLIDQINTNTNEQAEAVASVTTILTDLRDRLAAGASPDELEAIKTQLNDAITRQQGVEDNLRALGSDPANPIP